MDADYVDPVEQILPEAPASISVCKSRLVAQMTAFRLVFLLISIRLKCPS